MVSFFSLATNKIRLSLVRRLERPVGFPRDSKPNNYFYYWYNILGTVSLIAGELTFYHNIMCQEH
jgi:hypothetical protein